MAAKAMAAVNFPAPGRADEQVGMDRLGRHGPKGAHRDVLADQPAPAFFGPIF